MFYSIVQRNLWSNFHVTAPLSPRCFSFRKLLMSHSLHFLWNTPLVAMSPAHGPQTGAAAGKPRRHLRTRFECVTQVETPPHSLSLALPRAVVTGIKLRDQWESFSPSLQATHLHSYFSSLHLPPPPPHTSCHHQPLYLWASDALGSIHNANTAMHIEAIIMERVCVKAGYNDMKNIKITFLKSV